MMARRAHRRLSPLKILLLVLTLGIAVGGSLFLMGRGGDPYRTIPTLNIQNYLENGNSLRGNVYRLEGTIENSLAWSAGKGRLISVVLTGDSQNNILPVFIPSSLNQIHLQKGQRFLFKVEIGPNGLIQAQDLTKS